MDTPLRIVIVDDEALARAVVREYAEADASVEIVADCANGFEAVKAVSELYAPVSGEVVEVNTALKDKPETVNADPHGSWMIAVKLTNPSEESALLDPAQYQDLLK